MYFFSIWPPLYVVTRLANNRLFIFIEKMYFMWVDCSPEIVMFVVLRGLRLVLAKLGFVLWEEDCH